jgi:hypothetical protein
VSFVDLNKLIERDRELKGGHSFDDESKNLTVIYNGEARSLTMAWLKVMGQGDDKNLKPFQTKLLKRFVHTAAVTYATPPTRRLEVSDTALGGDDGPEQRLLASVYQGIDPKMKGADRWRSLLGQSIPYCMPSSERSRKRRPIVRIFQPHNVLRDVDNGDADDMRSDAAVAFRINESENPKQSVFHFWKHEDDGSWRAFRVDGNGDLIGGDADALFPDGEPPFLEAPFLVMYDQDPEGQAWVPIDQTRSAFALGMNVVLNELMLLVKYEAHTPMYGAGFMNKDDVPDRIGPGEFWAFENPESRINTVPMNPKLAEMISISRYLSEAFASGEMLPADYFLASRKFETGAAGKLRQQDLEARRQDQAQAARETEETLFEIIRSIHNAYAETWKRRELPTDASLAVELGAPWFPVDLAELQKTWAFDLSIGAGSMIDYLMERRHITRDQAVKQWERIQLDRERFPVRENPAAILGGPKSANGPGSATSENGEDGVERDASSMNPNRAASNEEASAVGAARRAVLS